jgi:hypothetical protein
MSGWHLEPALIRQYAVGAIGPELAASAEAHLMVCAACRGALASHVDAGRAAAIWAEVVDRVDAPRPSLLERALVRLGVSEATARLVAATPTLRRPWLAAIAGVLAFAAVAAQMDERWLRTFLVVAPLVPLTGVAVAFASGLDPTREIGLATPYPGLRLLLVRTAAVLAVTVPAAFVAGLALPGPSWLASAWLLPAAGLTSAALALTGRLRPVVAVGVVGLGWVAITTPIVLKGQAGVIFGVGAQLGWLALATACVLWLLASRSLLSMRLGRSS